MNCNECKEQRMGNEPIPFIVYESSMARMERTIKRLWILLILLVTLLVATNCLWLWYESQFEDAVETTEIEADQETETGNNYIVGGDLYGEAEG